MSLILAGLPSPSAFLGTYIRTPGFFSLTLTMDSREGNDEDEEEEDEGNHRFKGSGGPKLGGAND